MLVAGGSTNVTTYFKLSLSANGTAATGLIIADMDLQYVRSGVAPVAKVDATALAATDTAHTDNFAIEIDATDQPGLYRVDWPDAAFVAGVREVILTVKIATVFAEDIRVELQAIDDIADGVADEVYTGATHNVVNSLARRIRELSEALIISTGTCDAAGQTTTNVRLESGESSVDQVFRHKRLAIIAGTNAGFDGIASNYDGTNKDLTISPPLPEACDDTSDYEITPAIVHTETIGGGYEGGAVWYSNVVGIGAPGTEPYVNGTIDNPSNSITDTRTLLDALKLNIVHLLPGSSAILTQTWNNFEFIGAGYSLDLSDEDVSGCRFFGGSIFGTGTGSSRMVFRDCIHLSPLTVSTANWIGCNWSTTVTLSSAATYTVTNTVGTNAVLNFGTAVGNTDVNLHNWSGNIQIEAMGDTGTDTLFANMNGVFTEGTCTGGTVDIHGIYDTVGITNLTLSETRALTAAEVNAEVDAALVDVNLDHLVGTASGIPAVPAGTFLDQIMDDGTATFSRTTDSLQALRDRGDSAWTTGAGGSNPFVLQNTTIATLASQVSFTLTAGSADDAAYRNMLIVIEDSATATQKAVGVISAYTGSSLTVTLREDPGIFIMAVGDTVDVLAISPDILEILADTTGLNGDVMRGTDGVDTAAMRGTDSAALASVATEARLAELDAANLPAVVDSRMAEASIDTTAGVVDAVTLVATTTTNTDMRGTDGVDTATMRGTDGANTTTPLTAGQVNAEVLDVMNVDTYVEPGQVAPPATASIFVKINHMYKRWLNQSDNEGTTTQYYADNGTTVDQKQTTSESGGTVTVGKIVSGP